MEGCVSLCTFKLKKRSFLCHPVLLMHFICCQFLTCYLPISPTLIIDVGVFFETEKNICKCAVSDSVFFLNREPRSEERSAHTQTTQTEHNELGWPSAPSPSKPTSKSEHGGVLAINGRKVGHVSVDKDILWDTHTDKHRLYLNTRSSCFLHSLWACAPRVFYLLVLDSCQTLIDGWYEYL